MKQISTQIFKNRIEIFFLILFTFSTVITAQKQEFLSLKNKKTAFTEEEIKPTLDGFVAQSSGNFNSTSTSAELKRGSGFNREIYLTYDFSTLTIAAKSATLKIFCQSFDKFGDLTISIYCLPEYQTTGLTWTTRPTVTTAIATLLINQTEHANSWLECDISSSLAAILATPSKRATYVIKITAGNDALLRFAMSESATNKPSILLSDEDPTNAGVNSTIKMPTLFADNMVLQRDKPIKIYGAVLPNLPVVITFDGQTYNTQCSSDGKFSTVLPIKSASATAYTLTIAANNETQTYKNIVMGDVYLCGGQSNMAMYVSGSNADQVANAAADSNYPDLRFFEVAKIVSGGVLINAKDNPWKSAISQRIVNWSAVAFFVGRDLHKHLNVPIGLINVSHGGAPSDAFISPEAYANDAVLNAAKRPNGTGIFSYYQSPSSLYTAMISKVVGYPIKAVLWYQAEANATYWQDYKTIFKGLIKDWRTQFNAPTLPWLFVQLPSFDPSGDATKMTWAETRDIQLQVWREDPNAGMAVTIDLGEATNIHPTDKLTVAQRLVPVAKALVYGEQITHKSPIYKSHTTQGGDMFLTFENLGSGLKATKAITEFEIAGADKVYKVATATLLPDNRIKISNATVANPVYARYAFINFPTISIYTKDALSLPLSPFRTETYGVLNNPTWTGTTSTAWTVPTNWSTGIVPDSFSKVTIAGGTPNQPTISANTTINWLTINTGATLTVTAPLFTVAEAITNNGTMTLGNNSNLLQETTFNNTGNVIINRNSNPLSRLDYTIWSSPVTNENQFLSNFSPDTSSNRFYNYSQTTNLYSSVASPSTTAFGLAAGHLIRVPGNHPTTATVWNGTFIGVPNNGTITRVVTYRNVAPFTFGYNMIGNPYPSTLNASAFVAENTTKIESTLYFWRKTNGALGSAYATWINGIGGTASGAGSAVPNGTIQVGQGFFVRAKPGTNPALLTYNQTLNFTNDMRLGNTSTQFFKTKTESIDRLWLNLTNSTGVFSQTLIGYISSASKGVDDFDGRYINDSPIALTSNINNEEYTIQGRPAAFDPSDIVALNFKTDLAGEYTIALDNFEGVFATGQDVYLVDSKTGTETNLKTTAYTFTAATGVDNTRFSLKYQKTLKVDSSSFNENSVRVYKNNGTLFVNSGAIAISKIQVFDIQGRLIAEQKNVKATSAAITDLAATQQVLIVKITGEDNSVVAKKVIN